MEDKLQVWERSGDMALAAHVTPTGRLRTTTVGDRALRAPTAGHVPARPRDPSRTSWRPTSYAQSRPAPSSPTRASSARRMAAGAMVGRPCRGAMGTRRRLLAGRSRPRQSAEPGQQRVADREVGATRPRGTAAPIGRPAARASRRAVSNGVSQTLRALRCASSPRTLSKCGRRSSPGCQRSARGRSGCGPRALENALALTSYGPVEPGGRRGSDPLAGRADAARRRDIRHAGQRDAHHEGRRPGRRTGSGRMRARPRGSRRSAARRPPRPPAARSR